MKDACLFPGCSSPLGARASVHGTCAPDASHPCYVCRDGRRQHVECHDLVLRESPSPSRDPAVHLINLAGETLTEWRRSSLLHPNTLDLPDGTGGGGRRTWRDQAQASCDRAAREGRLTFAHVLDEEVAEALAATDPDKLDRELVQVLNVTSKWLWKLRREARLASLARSVVNQQDPPR